MDGGREMPRRYRADSVGGAKVAARLGSAAERPIAGERACHGIAS
jgi:hypothetical protein